MHGLARQDNKTYTHSTLTKSYGFDAGGVERAIKKNTGWAGLPLHHEKMERAAPLAGRPHITTNLYGIHKKVGIQQAIA